MNEMSEMNQPNRRAFLRNTAALAAASVLASCKSSKNEPIIHVNPVNEQTDGLSAEDAAAPAMSNGKPALRAMTLEADGSPLSADRMKTLHARDLHNDPLPQPIVLATGRARIELNDREPIQLSMRLNVPDFGEIYCYADNEGRGYTEPTQFDFVTECAKTRLNRVKLAYEAIRPAIGSIAKVDDQLCLALELAGNPHKQSLRYKYLILACALKAGETLSLETARTRISRLAAPRKDFGFGILPSGADTASPAFQQLIRNVFNFATCSWYTWKPENSPDNDRVDYTRMDNSINWCLKNGINPKGFGYLYMTRGATPDWIRPAETPPSSSSAAHSTTKEINTQPLSDPTPSRPHFNPRWGYDRIKKTYATVIRNTMQRYDGRIQYAEIMNEAHDKANLWGMTHDQILDMARMAFTSAREGSKTVKRQMNHCCMWAEYGKRANADGSRRWSPFQFVKACFDAGVDYEVIGLQLYYPQNDLFEIDRMLERFAVFNKPCHITELATASHDGLDPQSMRPVTYAPGWHGPWSPTMQADWTEAIYTLVYSKPCFEEIGWWDLSDQKGHFWPFGGLLDKNLQPKEAYTRLQQLQKNWGVAKSA